MADSKPCGILVNPRQSISIFGLWDQPRQVLEWQDITARNLTWRALRDSIELTPAQLKRVQPDPVEWVHRASITLQDLADMVCFPVNPFVHLHTDLAEVWSMHWTSDTLKQLNVTYDQLRQKGMNAHVMQHFNFTLGQWMNLGLMEEHVQGMDTDTAKRLFDMQKDEVVEVIVNYKL
jgi:hypothetical protein